MKSFIVIGAGAWGTALSMVLARQGHQVVLWGHDPQKMQVLAKERVHARYLPNIAFPENLIIATTLQEAFHQVTTDPTILVAVPSVAFMQTVDQLAPFINEKSRMLSATKGLSDQGEFFSDLVQLKFPALPFAVLSGPSFALEVAKGLPTAVVIGTQSPDFGQALLQAFHSDIFRVYLSEDVQGAQLGGAVKNVLAIAVGMSEGLGYGANARSALITRGLAELCRLGEKLGVPLNTLMGLSGVGDLVLTCTDNQSRNRRFGLYLGQGKTFAQAQEMIGQVVEGKMNAKQVMLLAEKHAVELPICQQVFEVIFEGLSPAQAVQNLLTRAPKAE
jgi:glycerol-3-phosphate dehydrogenase (NAD(P)+)